MTLLDTIQSLSAGPLVGALSSTHGNVVLADACSVVTPDQAAADNAAVLYDGLHETDASKALHGPVIAAAIIS